MIVSTWSKHLIPADASPERRERYLAREKRRRANGKRYRRQYARRKPMPKGRKRTELIHTMFPYGAPFDIVNLANAWGGWRGKDKPVRLNR